MSKDISKALGLLIISFLVIERVNKLKEGEFLDVKITRDKVFFETGKIEDSKELQKLIEETKKK